MEQHHRHHLHPMLVCTPQCLHLEQGIGSRSSRCGTGPTARRFLDGLPALETAMDAHVRVEWPESLGGPGAFAPVSQGQLQEVRQGMWACGNEPPRGPAGTATRRYSTKHESARLGPNEHLEGGSGMHHQAPGDVLHERLRHRAYQHGEDQAGHRAPGHGGEGDGQVWWMGHAGHRVPPHRDIQKGFVLMSTGNTGKGTRQRALGDQRSHVGEDHLRQR